MFRPVPAWLKVGSYFLILIIAQLIASRVLLLDSMWFYFGIALALSYAFVRSEGHSLKNLGLVPENASDVKHLFGGLGLGLLALLISAGITIGLNGARLVFTGRVDPVFLAILILINLFSAFAQELTYRGYPFQRLLKTYGPWVAQAAVTLPFAIMHLKFQTAVTWQQFLMTWLTTGLGSILYGLCYIKSGKLSLSIGLHLGWNLAQALVPRSPAESKTLLFTLVQDQERYQPLNVLWPYIGISLLLMLIINFLPFAAPRQKRIQS